MIQYEEICCSSDLEAISTRIIEEMRRPIVLKELVIKSSNRIYYMQNCKMHRKGGPAYIVTDLLLKIITEKYYIQGKLHNENGPAIIKKSLNSDCILEKQYYIDGNLLSEEEFEKQMLTKLYW